MKRKQKETRKDAEKRTRRKGTRSYEWGAGDEEAEGRREEEKGR